MNIYCKSTENIRRVEEELNRWQLLEQRSKFQYGHQHNESGGHSSHLQEQHKGSSGSIQIFMLNSRVNVFSNDGRNTFLMNKQICLYMESIFSTNPTTLKFAFQ